MVQKLGMQNLTGDSLTVGNTVITGTGVTVSGEPLSGGTGGAAVYANASVFPLINLTAGSFAFANNNNTLFMSNGSGWYKIALINQTPSITASIESANLGNDGNTVIFTYSITEPEGTPVTVSVSNSGISNTSLGNVVLYTSNNTVEVNNFAAEGSEWTGTVTLTVSDGVNVGTDSVTLQVLYIGFEQLGVSTANTVGLPFATSSATAASTTHIHDVYDLTGYGPQESFEDLMALFEADGGTSGWAISDSSSTPRGSLIKYELYMADNFSANVVSFAMKDENGGPAGNAVISQSLWASIESWDSMTNAGQMSFINNTTSTISSWDNTASYAPHHNQSIGNDDNDSMYMNYKGELCWPTNNAYNIDSVGNVSRFYGNMQASTISGTNDFARFPIRTGPRRGHYMSFPGVGGEVYFDYLTVGRVYINGTTYDIPAGDRGLVSWGSATDSVIRDTYSISDGICQGIINWNGLNSVVWALVFEVNWKTRTLRILEQKNTRFLSVDITEEDFNGNQTIAINGGESWHKQGSYFINNGFSNGWRSRDVPDAVSGSNDGYGGDMNYALNTNVDGFDADQSGNDLMHAICWGDNASSGISGDSSRDGTFEQNWWNRRSIAGGNNRGWLVAADWGHDNGGFFNVGNDTSWSAKATTAYTLPPDLY